MSKQNLPYYGLNAPAGHGMAGCSCTPKNKPVVTNTTLTRQTPTLTNPKTRLPIYSASPRGRKLAATFDPRGVAMRGPGMGRSEIYIDNNFQTSSSGNKSSQQVAQDYAGFAADIIGAARSGAAQNQALIGTGTREQRLAAIGKTGATSSVIYAVGAGASAYTYGISALLTLVPAEVYEKTFGQWFKDGFDCWGSSWTPTTAKQTFEIEAEFIKARLIQVLQSFEGSTFADIEKRINDFMKFFYNVQSHSRSWHKRGAKDCTARGLKLLVESLNNLKKELIPPLIQTIAATGHALVDDGTETVTYKKAYQGPGHPDLKINVERFKVRINPAALGKDEQAALSAFEEGPKNTNAGVSTFGIIALAAAAAGTYLYASNQ